MPPLAPTPKLSKGTEVTLRALFDPFRRYATRYQRAAPATAIRAIQRSIERVRLSPKRVGAAFQEVFELIASDPTAFALDEDRVSPTNRRRQALCEHFDTVDAAHPGATMLLLHRSTEQRRHFAEAAAHAGQLDEKAASSRGEWRSQALRVLAAHALEAIHGDVVRTIVRAHWAATNSPFKNDLTFGSLVNEAVRLGLTPLSVWPDAAHVRNAAAHGHWHYDPDSRTVLLTDKSWSRVFQPSDLHAEIRRSLWAVNDMQFVLGRCIKRDFLPGFLEMIRCSFGRSADEGQLASVRGSLETRMGQSFGFLTQLGWPDPGV